VTRYVLDTNINSGNQQRKAHSPDVIKTVKHPKWIKHAKGLEAVFPLARLTALTLFDSVVPRERKYWLLNTTM
jgi:hypothetical protein